MVRITNGSSVFDVTRGAFDGIYSRQGYREVIDGANDVELVAERANEELTEEELFALGIVEKPVSTWSKAEVKRFAEIKGISMAGTKSFGDAKERIKAFLAVMQ